MGKKNQKTNNKTWKLPDLPTAGELAELVRAGVMNAEEARDMVFGSAENDKEKVEALEKLVEFLQGLVTELSKNKTTVTTYPIYVETIKYRPTRYWDYYWGNTEKVLCQSGLTVTSKSNTTDSIANLKLSSGGTINTTAIANGTTLSYASSDTMFNAKSLDNSSPRMTLSVTASSDKKLVS